MDRRTPLCELTLTGMMGPGFRRDDLTLRCRRRFVLLAQRPLPPDRADHQHYDHAEHRERQLSDLAIELEGVLVFVEVFYKFDTLIS